MQPTDPEYNHSPSLQCGEANYPNRAWCGVRTFPGSRFGNSRTGFSVNPGQFPGAPARLVIACAVAALCQSLDDMPRRKQPGRMTVQDIRTILWLTHEQGLSVREVGLRLKLSKTTVATYFLRALEAGLNRWPLPMGRDDDATLKQVLFQRIGCPPRDLTEPDWPKMKRKGVTLPLWEQYQGSHPDGYGYTWFCERYREFESRISPRYRNRHEAGAVPHHRRRHSRSDHPQCPPHRVQGRQHAKKGPKQELDLRRRSRKYSR